MGEKLFHLLGYRASIITSGRYPREDLDLVKTATAKIYSYTLPALTVTHNLDTRLHIGHYIHCQLIYYIDVTAFFTADKNMHYMLRQKGGRLCWPSEGLCQLSRLPTLWWWGPGTGAGPGQAGGATLINQLHLID